MSSIAPSENCDSNPPSRLQHFSDPGHASTPRTVDRGAIIDALAERGIDLVALQVDAGRPDDDPFDLLCHLAWNAPLTTRTERAQRLRAKEPDLFQRYGEEARRVIDALLEKYAATGPDQLSLPQALKVQPISDFGNPSEIARLFGGPQAMREAVAELTEALYAA